MLAMRQIASPRRRWVTSGVLMACEVGAFFENDGPARRRWTKPHPSRKTRSGNCEVAPFTLVTKVTRLLNRTGVFEEDQCAKP
jgi:hypothetical protein